MILKMKKEEQTTDSKVIKEIRLKAVEALVDYLNTFIPESSRSDSKHALMGPVGKLLSRITNTGEINWGAVKGYVLSIHKNQQKGGRSVNVDATEKLDIAISHLTELKDSLPPTKWLRMVEDIDDEVYFLVYKEKLVGQRQWIRKEFHEWLISKYKTIQEVNEVLDDEDSRYDAFEEVEDPWSTPESMKGIVESFWSWRKDKKMEEK